MTALSRNGTLAVVGGEKSSGKVHIMNRNLTTSIVLAVVARSRHTDLPVRSMRIAMHRSTSR